jgi:hypothetical protein
MTRGAWAVEDIVQSKWDENLLSVALGDVSIKANSLAEAWREMTTKYLLRANIYLDAAAISNDTTFSFHNEKATGNELFDAFLTTYPAFTYTQDPETGVIWFHPKRVNYSDILNQQVKIARQASQVPMYADIYMPLCKLLAPNITDSRDTGDYIGEIDRSTHKPPIPYIWFYDVNMPAGVYSVREILNFCCAANPT